MKDPSVTIIDGGGANIASLKFALRRLGANAELTADPARVRAAKRIILPGVGAAAAAMRRLRNTGLADVLPDLQQPVLGICLGMQLFADASEEQDTVCLGIVPGRSEQLSGTPSAPVPNMGWCPISHRTEHPILSGIEDGTHFYFVHSYALPISAATQARAVHTEAFSAVVARNNFVATQFHPERSASAGAMILKNFLELPTCK